MEEVTANIDQLSEHIMLNNLGTAIPNFTYKVVCKSNVKDLLNIIIEVD